MLLIHCPSSKRAQQIAERLLETYPNNNVMLCVDKVCTDLTRHGAWSALPPYLRIGCIFERKDKRQKQ